MDFDDERWVGLLGGYRVPCDPRLVLRELEAGGDVERAWNELWNGLHHQGDVGEASYAAVPHLVRIHAARGVPDWNTYALVATIEEARRDRRNPDISQSMRKDYDDAWHELVGIGVRELRDATDPTLVCAIIGVVAMGKGQFTLGQLAVSFTENERQAWIDGVHGTPP